MLGFIRKKNVSAPAAPAASIDETRIGSSVTVNGDISGRGDVILDGTIKGNCRVAGRVTVERDGTVNGSISGKSVEIGGRLAGSLEASGPVVLTGSARVEAEIRTPSLAMAEGALVNGRVDITPSQRPMASAGGGKAGR
ncbi:MAG: bactofilin family protein [Desulfobacterales bacterium]